MSYTKKQWYKGLSILASDLNRMEEGIDRALNVQSESVKIEGADIDDIKTIQRLFNSYSTVFYSFDGYEHAPFEYGLIVTHDSPYNVFLVGTNYEQIGISLSDGKMGKCYKRTICPDFGESTDDEPVYKPAEIDWEEASYTKEEIDALLRSKSSYLDTVNSLPSNASKGSICKVLTACTIPSGKLSIPVSGVTLTAIEANHCEVEIIDNEPLKYFLNDVYEGGNGYTSDGSTYCGYLENENGVLEISVGVAAEYIIYESKETLEKYLINGEDVVCYLSDMSQLDTSLKEYEIEKSCAPGSYFIKGEGGRWHLLAEPSEAIYSAIETMRKSIETLSEKVKKLEIKKPMVFIDEVDTLPSSANEGEVYKQSEGLKVGDYLSLYMCEIVGDGDFVFYPDRIEAFNYQATENMQYAWDQVANDEKPVLMVFSVDGYDGNQMIHTIEAEEFSMVGEVSCVLRGKTSAAEPITANSGMLAILWGEITQAKTCVYHNGEWIVL